MLARASFERDGDIECPAGGYRTTNSRHDDYGNVVEGYVSRGLRDEHEALVHAEQVAFIGLDTTFDSRLLVVTLLVSSVLYSRILLQTRSPYGHT